MPESVKIIENGLVVTCDEQDHVGPYAILVKDDRIAELNADARGLKARYPNAEVINASEKVIFPGFIDPHYHGESFLLRNWTGGIPSSRWSKLALVRKALEFVRRDASKEDLLLLYRMAYFGALKSGFTTIAEFGFDRLDAPFLAAREAMKRCDVKGFVGVHNGEQADRARTFSSTSIRHGFVLPEEEDLTVYSLQTALRVAREMGWPIIAHLGESRKGLEAVRRNFNRSIVRVLEEYKILAQPIHLAHLASMEDGDDAVLADLGVPVIVNPVSAISKEAELPPLARFLQAGIPLALCSDWGVPDPFENMRAASTLVRLSGAEPVGPLRLIAMHTKEAARALYIEEDVGTIEGGKKADLTLVDVSDVRSLLPPGAAGLPAFLHRLVADTSSSRVSDVMINGEFFLRKGQVMTYSEEDLKNEYRDAVGRILGKTGFAGDVVSGPIAGAAPIIPLHGPDPQVSALQGDEPFEEGFRIVGTTGSLPQRPTRAEPEPREPDPGTEQRDIQRVFGDDDF